MTIDEAIYCMKSCLPTTSTEHCKGCPYYSSLVEDGLIYSCMFMEAHEMAIDALTKLKEEQKT